MILTIRRKLYSWRYKTLLLITKQLQVNIPSVLITYKQLILSMRKGRPKY